MTERGYAKGRAKRAEILDRALEVFGEVGYRGASLREIAARCGISHPGLLHHFPTKQALLLAVLERRDESAQAAVRETGATGVAELRQILDHYAGNAGRRDVVELFATLSAEATDPAHPAHAFFTDRYGQVVADFVAVYSAIRDEGALRPDVEPAGAARELVALMDGVQVQWLFDPDSVDMAGLVRAHVARQLTVDL